MNVCLIQPMGRIAGVAATETRERLLRAAADVFAERGYDGTRVADIAAAAGVSNGALYAHFGSKADLLVAALRAHGKRVLSDLLAADPGRPVTDLLLQVGRSLPRRQDSRGYLVVEALIAAGRVACRSGAGRAGRGRDRYRAVAWRAGAFLPAALVWELAAA